MRNSVVLGTLLLCLPTLGFAQRHLVAVASKGLPGVTIYNADSGEVVCQKKVDEVAPHELAFSPNGRTLYVPVYGNTLLGVPGTNEHAVYFINTVNCREISRVDTNPFMRLHGIAVTKSNMMYLTAEKSEVVVVMDANNQAVTATIPTHSDSAHMLVVTPDEKTAFVSNVFTKNIAVLDLAKKELVKKIDVGAENQRIDLSPDAKLFVTSLWKDGKLAFYDTAKHELAFTVPMEGSAIQSKFSADGKFVYAVGSAGGRGAPQEIQVWKIDVAEKKVALHIKEGIGKSAASFSINPWTGELYIADQATNEVVIVEPNELKLVKKIATEKAPDGIAFANSK